MCFFDKRGGRLFSVELDGDAERAAYTGLCERFGVVPVPKMHCRGCGKCSCGHQGAKRGPGHAHHAHR